MNPEFSKKIKKFLFIFTVVIVLANFVGVFLLLNKSGFRHVKAIFKTPDIVVSQYLDNDYDEPLRREYFFGEDIIFDYGNYLIEDDSLYLAGFSPANFIIFKDHLNFANGTILINIRNSDKQLINFLSTEITLRPGATAIVSTVDNSIYCLKGKVSVGDIELHQNQKVEISDGQLSIKSVGEITTLNKEEVQKIMNLAKELDIL